MQHNINPYTNQTKASVFWHVEPLFIIFPSSWENSEICINNGQDVSVKSFELIMEKNDSNVMHIRTSDKTKTMFATGVLIEDHGEIVIVMFF